MVPLAATGAVLALSGAFAAGYKTGTHVEGNRTLAALNERYAEVQQALEAARNRALLAEQEVSELRGDFARSQRENRALAAERERLLADRNTVITDETGCSYPDVRADWWLHQCALDPTYCDALHASDAP